MSIQNIELFKAIINDKPILAIKAISSGANIKFIDRAGNSPAHYAAANGCLDIFKTLVFLNEISNLSVLNNYSNTPFLMAVANNQLNIIEYLIYELEYELSEFEWCRLFDDNNKKLIAYVEYLKINLNVKRIEVDYLVKPFKL